MFQFRLSQNGRKIAHSRYQLLIEQGCNLADARNAAEAMTLEQENFDYKRSDYDQQAIHSCWETLTENGNDAE